MNPLTADQASFMLHTLGLPALRNEHRLTSAIIAAIPSERADYRPHADSRTAFEIAWHIVGAEIKYLDAIAAGVFPHDLKPVPDSVRQPSDILAWYTERFDPAMNRLDWRRAMSCCELWTSTGSPLSRRSCSCNSS
jgi:hypothetical protein